jgi:Tol biopolymer transport system component
MSKRALLLTVVTIAVMILAAAPFVYAGATERVSVDINGNQADSHSYGPSITPDGRYVAFSSYASDLVPDDTNGQMDVFVHDRQTGIIERVSVDSNGNQQANGAHIWWHFVGISADGRYVAFSSYASNLVPDDTNNHVDVFVHDRQTGVTERVSVDSNGNELYRGGTWPSISGDGRYVAFTSLRTLYIHDRETGVTEDVSVDINGRWTVWGGQWPSISANGRYVSFGSSVSNLVPGDTNRTGDIFVRDRETNVTERVSVDSNGNQANNYSGWSKASISPDGRYVVFDSGASNLVPGDTNNQTDIFVHDRQTGITERVNVDSDGNEANGNSLFPSISDDGRYVAFSSFAANLVLEDTNRHWDVFVHDRQTGVTERASVDSEGNQTRYYSCSRDNHAFCNVNFYNRTYWPSISADGKYVAFGSFAPNTVPNDTNVAWDVFVHTRGPVVPDTIDGLIALVEELYASGDITNAGIAKGLIATLNSALKALENGNVHTASNTLLAFINKVQAQSGKKISEDAAALLIEAANNILATLQ